MDDQPPLIWPQFESTGYTHRRSPIPAMLVPAMIGVISAAIFLLFVNFVIPPFLSVTSQILQPSSVKRGWDSINVILVVFAILCGVLARRNDDGLSSESLLGGEEEEAVTSGEMTVGENSKIASSSSAVSEQWFDDVYDADRLKIYESVSSRSFSHGVPVTGTVPLRRSCSSYPDLRQGVFRETGDRRFRFYDDFEIDKYRSHDSSSYEQFQNRSKIEIEEESEPKEIQIDTFVVKPSSPQQQSPAPPPPPPPPPPPVEVSQKPRRTHRSVRNRDIQENAKRNETKFKRAFQPPPSPPPPPPPPPPPITATPPRKQGTLQRRKSNAAKEIKMVFASLYNQGKRKKKIQKSKRKERIESSPLVVDETEPPQYQSFIPPPSPPPPPPPPPPPRSSQSVFYGLFKKGVKSNKKIHSVPAPPPPPPLRHTQFDPQTPPRRVKSGRPPRPTKPTNFNEENNGQGSPLIQITPPPPPPPPFRVPPLKFVVSGDFAKIRSNQSSRCSSPEREVIDIGWGLELTQSDGGVESKAAVGGGGMPGFCPSPDVDTKADNFIARLRDEWRLDKINSVNRKR
ncbi:hypothetical protein ISN44_As13g020610 [Arabidopsis suecica]|uniref:Hydroxyproline-rich glycoprotein family protein n=1 Tax=Arabidopsis suecica TaxID=45249 RepID=A0A8T1XU65_ARASU|nr:hypothetical protein ISN44_As13g020610 [Arabidopsis suecica]